MERYGREIPTWKCGGGRQFAFNNKVVFLKLSLVSSNLQLQYSRHPALSVEMEEPQEEEG
jgi:hypothetical protein